MAGAFSCLIAELDWGIAMNTSDIKFVLDDDAPFIVGETKEYLTYIDYRTVPSLEGAKDFFWFKDWHSKGKNHREEKGMIACDRKEKCLKRVITVKDLITLIALQEKVGQLTIENSGYLEVKKEMKI